MAPITTERREAPGGWARRLMWFAGLYGASVAVVVSVAWVLRRILIG
jgi:hypothetical protein